MNDVVYKGEVQLAGWSETHNGGAKVTLWLPDGDALANFKDLTARKGNTAGHILACMITTVDCNSALPEKKGGDLAKLAGIFINTKAFQIWAKASSVDEADAYIKKTCRISSKIELDHDALASQLFHELIRLPFNAWYEARK